MCIHSCVDGTIRSGMRSNCIGLMNDLTQLCTNYDCLQRASIISYRCISVHIAYTCNGSTLGLSESYCIALSSSVHKLGNTTNALICYVAILKKQIIVTYVYPCLYRMAQALAPSSLPIQRSAVTGCDCLSAFLNEHAHSPYKPLHTIIAF